MAKTTTEIVIVEDTQPPEKRQQPHLQIPNLFSLFPKFNLHFPFLNPPKPQKHAGDSPTSKAVSAVTVVGDVDEGGKGKEGGAKPSVVRFPKAQIVAPPPLEAEVEESSTKTSNPVIIWQVYALGAFFVSRWIWARWNERKARGKSPNDGGAEGRHSDDGHSSSDNNNDDNNN